MRQRLHLNGQTFGDWTVIDDGTSKNGEYYYLCQCKCGKTALTRSADLRNGKSANCGCSRIEQLKERSMTHGATSSERTQKESCIHQCWKAMLQRCFDPKHKSFKNYGGRGVQVC